QGEKEGERESPEPVRWKMSITAYREGCRFIDPRAAPPPLKQRSLTRLYCSKQPSPAREQICGSNVRPKEKSPSKAAAKATGAPLTLITISPSASPLCCRHHSGAVCLCVCVGGNTKKDGSSETSGAEGPRRARQTVHGEEMAASHTYARPGPLFFFPGYPRRPCCPRSILSSQAASAARWAQSGTAFLLILGQRIAGTLGGLWTE
ncbi:hypothetical protein JRQ81_002244, partial [Phrynocephalus forsythii]